VLLPSIKLKPVIHVYTIAMDNPHLRIGSAIIGTAWLIIANKIVDKAIGLYEVTPEQAVALRKVFLRPGDYFVDYD